MANKSKRPRRLSPELEAQVEFFRAFETEQMNFQQVRAIIGRIEALFLEFTPEEAEVLGGLREEIEADKRLVRDLQLRSLVNALNVLRPADPNAPQLLVPNAELVDAQGNPL